MSLILSKQKSMSGEESGIDLDVSPIMNILIILIPFLISMAVFTHLATISFSLPPNAGSALDQSAGKPRIKLTVVVSTEYCAITHGDRMLDSIPQGTTNGNELLVEKLKKHRSEIEIQDEAIIAVRDAVKFQNMVKVMDACRNAGFVKIGVSTATANAEKGV